MTAMRFDVSRQAAGYCLLITEPSGRLAQRSTLNAQRSTLIEFDKPQVTPKGYIGME